MLNKFKIHRKHSYYKYKPNFSLFHSFCYTKHALPFNPILFPFIHSPYTQHIRQAYKFTRTSSIVEAAATAAIFVSFSFSFSFSFCQMEWKKNEPIASGCMRLERMCACVCMNCHVCCVVLLWMRESMSDECSWATLMNVRLCCYEFWECCCAFTYGSVYVVWMSERVEWIVRRWRNQYLTLLTAFALSPRSSIITIKHVF